MSAHTPGPWDMPDSGQGRISKVGKNGGWDGMIATADCGDYARSQTEGLANAQLIAAAPDLLAACKLFMTYHYGVDKYDVAMMLAYADAEQAIRVAVAKATGGAA